MLQKTKELLSSQESQSNNAHNTYVQNWRPINGKNREQVFENDSKSDRNLKIYRNSVKIVRHHWV